MEALLSINYKYIVIPAAAYGLYKYWQNSEKRFKIRVRSEIEKMPGFWRTIWTSLNEKYGVNILKNKSLSIARQPTAGSVKIKDLGWMEASVAGIIGEIQVWQVTGPKTFEEACEEGILYDGIEMRSDESTAEDVHFDSWQQFWDASHHGVKHDRPDWTGAPLRAVWIRQIHFDGDYSAIIAQRDMTTYYVVTFSAY